MPQHPQSAAKDFSHESPSRSPQTFPLVGARDCHSVLVGWRRGRIGTIAASSE
jgi:hypothetical protein